MHRVFLILTAVLVFFSPCAFAEELPLVPEDPPTLEQPEAKIDPFSQDIPDKFIEEAAQVQQKCESGYVLSQYFNCECRALKYLEERVRQGEFVEASQIEASIQNECRDSTMAAGMEYGDCLKQYTGLAKDQDPEEFCTCYANTYSDLMDRLKPYVRARTIVQIRTRALQTCSNPVYARQKYGGYLPPKKP